ncbi:hypothetical protein BO71DRAFT_148136 [Aspergillus ellipticus CBS 707.79]|uniref:Uncharacterized protein n=1 Tax=Aspergillus ellipticus CBS 707.79 TaxID=1448320 RepID=A0A319DAM7_9EURO|nr:hypothetical protein BO71DRAFT_148136 [Aspergillus ellipticus CBS 707.79]
MTDPFHSLPLPSLTNSPDPIQIPAGLGVGQVPLRCSRFGFHAAPVTRQLIRWPRGMSLCVGREYPLYYPQKRQMDTRAARPGMRPRRHSAVSFPDQGKENTTVLYPASEVCRGHAGLSPDILARGENPIPTRVAELVGVWCFHYLTCGFAGEAMPTIE